VLDSLPPTGMLGALVGEFEPDDAPVPVAVPEAPAETLGALVGEFEPDDAPVPVPEAPAERLAGTEPVTLG